MTNDKMRAVKAAEALLRAGGSSYPDPFAARVAGRSKRPLAIFSVCRPSA